MALVIRAVFFKGLFPFANQVRTDVQVLGHRGEGESLFDDFAYGSQLEFAGVVSTLTRRNVLLVCINNKW